MKYAQSDSIPLISWPLKSFTMLLEMPNRYFQVVDIVFTKQPLLNCIG